MHSSQQTHRPTPTRRFRVKCRGHAKPGGYGKTRPPQGGGRGRK
jgi:hypothetical protein